MGSWPFASDPWERMPAEHEATGGPDRYDHKDEHRGQAEPAEAAVQSPALLSTEQAETSSTSLHSSSALAANPPDALEQLLHQDLHL